MTIFELTHADNKLFHRFFRLVEEAAVRDAEIAELKALLIDAVCEHGHDIEGTATGKTVRKEATVQHRGKPNHVKYSETTAIGRVDNTAALAEANRRLRALGGEEVDANDFRGKPTISRKLEWVEQKEAEKAAKKEAKEAAKKAEEAAKKEAEEAAKKEAICKIAEETLAELAEKAANKQ